MNCQQVGHEQYPKYEFEYQSRTEFKDWATGAPFAFAEEVLTVWGKGVMETQELQEVQVFITNLSLEPHRVTNGFNN
jgi:hypothetical protein